MRDGLAVSADGAFAAREEGVRGECCVVGGPVPVGLGACVAAFVAEGFLEGVQEVAVPGKEIGLTC